jgi:hypothetical protein
MTSKRTILAVRLLKYRHEDGTEQDLNLRIGMPYVCKGGVWKCGFELGPPLNITHREGYGVDALQALLHGLGIVRASIDASPLRGKVHWGGMFSCGLPELINGQVELDILAVESQ